jgi:hypothetical protein
MLRAHGFNEPHGFHVDESIRACTTIVQHCQVISKVALLKFLGVVCDFLADQMRIVLQHLASAVRHVSEGIWV